MIRLRFKTRAVEDCRPLVDFNEIGMPWWCSGFGNDDGGDYAVIVCYLPEMANLKRYWDDAYDITSEQAKEIVYTSRFPKPAWLEEVKV